MSKVTYGGAIFTQGVGAPIVPCKGGYVSNLGLDLTAGKLKIVQADGNDLTAQQEGHVAMPSVTAGRQVALKVTDALHFFEDANGASDIIGEEFDTTAGVAWGNPRPFMLYAVNLDDTDAGLKFAISPDPARQVTPSASSFLGYQGNPAATPNQSSMFFLTSTNISSYTSKPCIPIGSFTMTKDASDDWTASLTVNDGIGKFRNYNGQTFIFPTGQMGATSGQYVSSLSGTVPTFSSNTYKYIIGLDGICTSYINLNGDGGVAGVGSADVDIALPYIDHLGMTIELAPFRLQKQSGAEEHEAQGIIIANSSKFELFHQLVVAGALQGSNDSVRNNDFPSGARFIRGSIRYKAF